MHTHKKIRATYQSKKTAALFLGLLMAILMLGCSPIGERPTSSPTAVTTSVITAPVEKSPPVTTTTSPGPYPITTLADLPYPYPPVTYAYMTVAPAQATARAEIVLTLTAQPTSTPWPTFPVGAAPCQGSDLSAQVHTEGATGGEIYFLVTLTNSGNTVCYLQGPPNITFVDKNGHKVDLLYGYYKSIAPEALSAAIGIGVGERVSISMLWDNWCKPPVPNAKIRLTLSDDLGRVDIPLGDLSNATCNVPDAGSSLGISEYRHAP